MTRGAILVEAPDRALALGTWRVHVAGATGRPGEIIAAPAGDRRVLVEADLRFPDARLAARLAATVPVAPGRITRVRIVLPGLPQRSLRAAPALRRARAAASSDANGARL